MNLEALCVQGKARSCLHGSGAYGLPTVLAGLTSTVTVCLSSHSIFWLTGLRLGLVTIFFTGLGWQGIIDL